MSLSFYNKKRKFSETPEPEGKEKSSAQGLRFVIQKHDASHLHYDFRLEMKGALKSWAVPKGPCLDPKVKRLAMHVEDHPVEYGSFEGIIPKGQYGGGTVMLWDKGIWIPLDENPYQAYEKGHLRFELQAEKLNGRWDLIRFKDENHWFLIKFDDEFAESDYDITKDLDKSVISQKSIDQIALHYDKLWSSEGLTKVSKKKPKKIKAKQATIVLPKGLAKNLFPDFIPPELATLVDKPPEGEQWLHEIKFDGYRILAFKKGNEVVLKSRNNKEWTSDLGGIAEAIATLPYENLILDGEVVALDKQGRSSFQLLQNSFKSKQSIPLVYFLFDILYLGQYDLRKLPLVERKTILKQILSNASDRLHYSDHLIKEGKKLYEYACEKGLEGIVAKNTLSPYSSKRSKNWLKIKCVKRQEFVIGGYSPPKGGRSHFGSLFLGFYNKNGELEFAGNVGTGFSEKILTDIFKQLQKFTIQSNPFTTKPPGYTQAKWVEPKLVCEVEFTEWTKDNHLRHPSFKGLRLDKKASEVIFEEEIPLEAIQEKTSTKKAKKGFNLTNPAKILYPEDKISKSDLLSYYETVSDYILPFISNRPLTLVRCPSSYGQCFYQRHFNKTTPKTLHAIDIATENEDEQYIYLDDKEGLFSLVQMGVLEIHPWGSQIKQIEEPDIIVIDLDPAPDVPWKRVVAAAREIRGYLTQYHLTSFVKSTGGKGLHVVVPVKPEYDWEKVKEFTHVFVQFLEKLKPDEYISTMSKSKRVGKIFIDYLRNQRTATAVAVYSTRARLHAPVSTPLFWDELSDHIEDNSYTIKTLPNRLNQLKEDPWNDFFKIRQSLRLDDL
ncbi:MAG: DNA ligase D [Tatlockia sp.]|nr:DNA ligase D [Tatlockia sp.]